MIIEEKLQTWSKKALTGENGYELLFHRNGKPICVSEKYEEAVLAYRVIVWNTNKTIINISWDIEHDKEIKKQITLIVKKEKKLLLYDGEAKVYGIGLGEKEDIKMMIFYKFEHSGTLMVASGEIPEIRVLSYIRSGEQDAVHHLMTLISYQFPIEDTVSQVKMDNEIQKEEIDK